MSQPITPQYDASTDTWRVDWPGRPDGPLPTFKTFEAARDFVASRQVPAPSVPSAAQRREERERRERAERSIRYQREARGIHVQVQPAEVEQSIAELADELDPTRHDIRRRPGSVFNP